MRRDHKKALSLLERDMEARRCVPAHTSYVLDMVSGFLLATPMPLTKVLRGDVETYLAGLNASGCSADFQFRTYHAIRSLFRVLVADEHLEEAPTDRMIVHKPACAVPLLLSEDAVNKLLAAAGQEPENRSRRAPVLSRALALRDRACVELLYGLGLRISEASRASLTDLRLKEREILVTRSKRGKVGVLPLPPASIPHLERYVLEGRPVLARPGADRGQILLTRFGTPLPQPVMGRIVTAAALRAGLLRAHPHALRRAVATHLIRSGVSVRAVQDFLGHNSLESTARYLEVDREDLRRAVSILEQPE